MQGNVKFSAPFPKPTVSCGCITAQRLKDYFLPLISYPLETKAFKIKTYEFILGGIGKSLIIENTHLVSCA